MLQVALEYPSEDCNGFRVYRPARGGKSCEHSEGYKIINQIPLSLVCKMKLGTQSSFRKEEKKTEPTNKLTQCLSST